MKIYVVWCWEEFTNTESAVGYFRSFDKAKKRMLADAKHDNDVNNLQHAEAFFKYGEDEGLKSDMYVYERSVLIDDDEGWKTKYWIKEEELQ